MRIGIISDVHDDGVAFESVIQKIRGEVDEIWSLGDVVGYGVHDTRCINLLRADVNRWVAGNHEDMLRVVINSINNQNYHIGKDRFIDIYERICFDWRQNNLKNVWKQIYPLTDAILKEFNRIEVSYSTRPEVVQTLLLDCVLGAGKLILDAERKQAGSDDDWNWFTGEIHSLQEPIKVIDEITGWRIILVHGSPVSSNEYVYFWDGHPWNKKDIIAYKKWSDLMEQIRRLSCKDRRLLVLMGHAHIPLYCPIEDDQNLMDLDATKMAYGKRLSLGGWATLINPGSVGHPRDLDPRAAYAIVDLDDATVCYYRETIDRRIVHRRMLEHYIPASLQIEYLNAPAPDYGNDSSILDILNKRRNNGRGW